MPNDATRDKTVAEAVATVFGALSDDHAEEFEALALKAGLLRRCSCGYNVSLDDVECGGCGCAAPPERQVPRG